MCFQDQRDILWKNYLLQTLDPRLTNVPQRQNHSVLRRPPLRRPRALVPQDQAGGGGASTLVAGTGEKTYLGKRGYPLTVDTSVDEIEAAEFDGLVIPGGYAPDIMRRSAKLLRLTREIYQAGKPVAFICHAGWVPISAGIVKGKRGTSVGAIKDDLVNAGMLWEDSAVVVDGNLISSRTPADLPQFMKALIAALEGERSAVSGERESPARSRTSLRR